MNKTLISSKDNSLVKHINKLLKSAKYRRESSLFVAEGLRVCYDAFLSDAEIASVICTEQAYEKNREIVDKLISRAEKNYFFSDSVFKAVSDTKSPQGILCVIKTLDKKTLFDKMEDGGKFLALDNIQDPSNLGTILRTAEAVGIDAVLLSSDCCDIYSPKVVRGSMGAVFRLPYSVTDSIARFISERRDIKSYAAVVSSDAKRIDKVSFEEPCMVCIGNEGNGLKSETIAACDECITIPMRGRAESLNASIAAGIIMWEMQK
ncbi:MAG: RNA methyltransferase [Ruminococcus sp.]|nr:RNA methyltransferase [Ruminococcus sp.]